MTLRRRQLACRVMPDAGGISHHLSRDHGVVHLQRPIFGLTTLALGFALLGLIPLFGLELAASVSPLQISILRLGTAALLISPCTAAILFTHAERWRLLARAVPSGFVIATATATYQVALATIPVALAIVLVLACMLSVAAIFDRRRPPTPLLAIVIIALALAVLLAYPADGIAASVDTFGIAMAIACGAVFGFLPLTLRCADDVPTLLLTGAQFAAGTACLVVVDLLIARLGLGLSCGTAFSGLPAQAWLIALLSGVMTAALPYALIAWGRNAARATDLQVALASSCEPIAAVFVAVSFLHQPSSFALWVALAATAAINVLYPSVTLPPRRPT